MYVFIEKQEKLSLNYPQYSLLSGALLTPKSDAQLQTMKKKPATIQKD